MWRGPTSKIGESVELELSVTQHSRDIALIKSLDAYLGCGTTLELATNSASPKGRFYVKKFSYIYNIIIPFYKKYPIQGTKSLDELLASYCFAKPASIIFVKWRS